MRVLHIGKFYPPHRGGIETHLQTLCRGLSRRIEVEVVVANDANQGVVEHDGPVTIRRLPRLFELAGAPICPSLVGSIRRSRTDIIHLHIPNPSAGASILLSRHPAPLVISWHSDIVRQRMLARVIAPIEHLVERRATALIASSSIYADSSPALARHRDKVHIIPYGIEYRVWSAASSTQNAVTVRRRYGDRLLIAVGRLVYYKGFDVLIRAMTAIDGHLLIVGDGPLRASLAHQTVTAGVTARVSFLGDLPQSELIDHLHAADVFVLASIARSEAFGIVQLEAMAVGKPVVNTYLASGVPFVSRDGETGITVPPNSPEALAGAVNRLLDDAALRARYGAAGQRRVANEFNAELMVQRTLDLYRSILAHSSASASPLPKPRNADTDRPRSSRPVWPQ